MRLRWTSAAATATALLFLLALIGVAALLPLVAGAAQRAGALLVTGPPSLARGVATVFTLRPSVWSPFWPSITVTPTISPVGAATVGGSWFLNSASARTLTLTSQRSDQINITVSFQLSNSGFLLPPENLVLATAGAAIWTLVGSNKCRGAGTTLGPLNRDSPVSNHAATLSSPHSLIFSRRMKLFYLLSASSSMRNIRAFDPADQSLAIAVGSSGSGTFASGYANADGSATAVRFRSVTAAAMDTSGSFLYFADEGTLRRLDVSSRAVATLAGTLDTSATAYAVRLADINARLPFWSMELLMDGVGGGRTGPYTAGDAIVRSGCLGLAVDELHQRLYFSDPVWHLLRFVQLDDLNFAVRTVQGTPGTAGYRDSTGVVVSGLLNKPSGLAVINSAQGSEAVQSGSSAAFDFSSRLFIADEFNNAIRVMDLDTLALSTFVGSPSLAADVDGVGTAAGVYRPSSVSVDSSNSYLFISSRSTAVMRRVSLQSGAVETLRLRGFSPSVVTAVSPHPQWPHLAYLIDSNANQIWQLDLSRDNEVMPFLGGGSSCSFSSYVPGLIDGVGSRAESVAPFDIQFNPFQSHQLLVADRDAQALRTLDLRDTAIRTVLRFPATVMAPTLLAPHPLTEGLLFAASPTAIVWANAISGAYGALAGVHGSTGSADSPSALFTSIGGMAVSVAAAGANQLFVGDKCCLRSVDISGALALDSAIVSSLSGTFGECGNVEGGPGVARFSDIRSVMAVSASLLYLAESSVSSPSFCGITRFNLQTLERTVVAGGSSCGTDLDEYGLAARFVTIRAASYSADTQYIYSVGGSSGGTGLRYLDLVSGRVGTVLASTTSFTADGVGSVGIALVNGVAAAPTGHQLYVVEADYSHRIRAVALFAMPVVRNIVPSVGPANKPAVVTLSGFYFGTSAFELVAIAARSTAADSREFTCTLVQWMSSQTLRCRLSSNVPVNTELRFRVNVRGPWGEVSSFVFRTVAPPLIDSVAPSVSSAMPSLMHLYGSFGSNNPTDLISATYGASGVEFSCDSPRLQNSSYLICAPSSSTAVGARVFFMVNMGNQFSAVSTSSFMRVAAAPFTLTSVCPASVPSVYSSSVALMGDFSALKPNDANLPTLGLVVELRRNDDASITDRGSNVRLVSATMLTVETPMDLPAGSVWDVRVTMAGLSSSWLLAALTVVQASSPIISVSPRIIAPLQPAVLTLSYNPAFFCSALLPRTDISGVTWGGNGAEKTAPSFSLDEEANTIRVSIPGADLSAAGAMHALALQVRGVRSPPSLRDYRQTNAPQANEMLKRFAFGNAAIFAQSRLEVQVPSKLSGAVPLTVGPATAPMFGPLVLKVRVFARPSLPIGAAEALQSTVDLTWTGADWKVREVPVDLLSVAATFRVEMALDAASPSAPYFLAPAASVTIPAIAAVPTRTVFGPGPQCSASGNDSSLLADPLGARGPLQNPADALFDPSTDSYLVLDQDGAVLRRWFPATNSWQLVFGVEQSPEGLPTEPRDGPLNQALFGRNLYARSKMALSTNGARLYLYDAAHWQIRVINFASATSSLLSGVNAGPLSRSPSIDVLYSYGWMIGGSNAAGQRWLDVKALAVDRDEKYLYVLEMQWVRRIVITTGAMTLLSGRDSYGSGLYYSYSDGVGSDCLWGDPGDVLPQRNSYYGISSMLLTADGSTLYLSDKYGVLKSVNTTTDQCKSIPSPGYFISDMAFDATQRALFLFQPYDQYYTNRITIYRVDLTNNNAIATVAKVDFPWGTRDGPLGGVVPAQQGTVGLLTSLRTHPSGNFLYFADNSAHRIRTFDLAKQTIGTLVGGGVARRADDDASDPNGALCPGEATVPGIADATGLDAQFNILTGMFVSPPVSGRTRVMWVSDWQNTSMSSIRRVDLDSDAVTTPFSITGHVVDFQPSATQADVAFLAMFNPAGSIFRLNLATSSYDPIGAVNTGPLGNLGRIRSMTTVDDSEIWLVIQNRPGLFSLSTSINSDLMLRAGAASIAGDIDGTGTAARLGVVKHLCRSTDGVFIYFTTWAPFKVLRFHTINFEVRTIAGLSLARTPTVPIPRDGFPPNAALAYPTTLAVSPDGKSLFVLEYLEGVTGARYDRTFQTEVYQRHFQLRQINLATGEVTTLSGVNDGGAPLSVSQIISFTSQGLSQQFDQPHPLAFSRSADPTRDGVDGAQLYVGRETRVRVLAALGSPSIADVRPRVSKASASVTVTLTGSGFGNAASELLAVEYRDQTAFPTTESGVTGSLMPTVKTCTPTWHSSTRITCTFTTGAAVGVRLAFRVRVAASGGRRLVSRHSAVELLTIPTPLVAAVQSNTGYAGVSQRVTLTTATRLGFGSGADTRSVRFGVIGSTTSKPCTDPMPVDEFSLSCMVGTAGALTAPATSYWFAVSVPTIDGASNPAVTAVNSFTTVPNPTLSAVCPTGSTLVGQAQMVTLFGNYLGSDARDVVVTLGSTGVQFTCADVRLLGSGSLTCILPARIPLDYGNIRFKVAVRGRASSVSSFTFYLHSLAAVASGASSAVISSMSSARVTPNLAGETVTLYSATSGFGACAAMLTGVWYTTSTTTSTAFGGTCTSFEWISSSEVTCTLPAISPNSIIRGQVAMLDVRGPGSATSIYSQTKSMMASTSVPAAMLLDTSYTAPTPGFSTQISSNPYTLRISMVGQTALHSGSALIHWQQRA